MAPSFGRRPNIIPQDTILQPQIAPSQPDAQTLAALQAKDEQLKQLQARLAEVQYKEASMTQHAERLEYEKLRAPQLYGQRSSQPGVDPIQQ